MVLSPLTLNAVSGYDGQFQPTDGDATSFAGIEHFTFIDKVGGDDTITTGDGNDLLKGRSGTNVLSGDSDSDELFGGNGRDWLYGGTEGDTLDGGDTLTIEALTDTSLLSDELVLIQGRSRPRATDLFRRAILALCPALRNR